MCTLRHTSSAANFNTAVNGVVSGTLNLWGGGHIVSRVHTPPTSLMQHSTAISTSYLATGYCTCPLLSAHTLYGSFGSDVRVILNVTFEPVVALRRKEEVREEDEAKKRMNDRVHKLTCSKRLWLSPAFFPVSGTSGYRQTVWGGMADRRTPVLVLCSLAFVLLVGQGEWVFGRVRGGIGVGSAFTHL